MINFVRTSPIAVFVGAVLGLLGAMICPLLAYMLVDAYNDRNPPWVGLESEITSRGTDWVNVSIRGERTRASSCRFLRAAAQATGAGDGWDAVITRLDNGMIGKTRPDGPQLVGLFDVRPVLRARVVEIRVEFDCAGRPFTQTLARVPMEVPK